MIIFVCTNSPWTLQTTVDVAEELSVCLFFGAVLPPVYRNLSLPAWSNTTTAPAWQSTTQISKFLFSAIYLWPLYEWKRRFPLSSNWMLCFSELFFRRFIVCFSLSVYTRWPSLSSVLSLGLFPDSVMARCVLGLLLCFLWYSHPWLWRQCFPQQTTLYIQACWVAGCAKVDEAGVTMHLCQFGLTQLTVHCFLGTARGVHIGSPA